MQPLMATVQLFAGNFAPRGWAFCEGQLLAINSHQALFSLLGTTYGGDGRTSFALPDLRGAVPTGVGQRPGQPTNMRLGQKGGADSTTLITQNLPAHNHTIYGSSNAPDQLGAAGGFFPTNARGSGAPELYASSIGTAQQMGNEVGNTGNNTAFNNLQPYTTMYYIIAMQGIFPSRN